MPRHSWRYFPFFCGHLDAQTAIETTLVDAEAVHGATFQSHNQKIVRDGRGIFMTPIRMRTAKMTAQQWRLSWRQDGGRTFTTPYEATDATNPPALETDSHDILYLGRPKLCVFAPWRENLQRTALLMKRFCHLLVLLGASFAASAAIASRPNIVFILSDDLAQGDVGAYGQRLIQTPRLDRVAREGTRYTQAYCGTSVCAPSRTVLLTGLHSGHAPVRGNWEMPGEGQLPLPAGTVTVAQILKDAGYATAVAGKWGMGMFDSTGSPLAVGFEHQFGYNCQRHAHSYFPTHLYRDGQRVELPGNDGKGVGKTYAQELIQRDVLDWVRAKKAQPFFLYYAITLPHGRNEIDDLGIYADRPWTAQQKAYAAQVTRLDRDVGQLLDLLAELGLDEKTLVMLAGDNGSSFEPGSEMGRLFEQAANGLRGFKRGLYEGALRQAALARWPGTVPAGRVSDEPWAFWDFLPTAAELAGARLPAGYKPDGHSLVSFLRGGSAPAREYFYWELHEQMPLQAVRFGQWKAVKPRHDRALELYDLTADPAEAQNLAAQKPDLVAKAESLMKAAHTPDPHWPLDHRAPERDAARAKNRAKGAGGAEKKP